MLPYPPEADAIRALQEFGTKVLVPAIPVAVLTSFFGAGATALFFKLQHNHEVRMAKKAAAERSLEERTGEEDVL